MGSAKEDLIKIRVALDGADAATTKLAALNKETDAVNGSASKSAKSIKALSHATKASAGPMGAAAAAAGGLAAAQTQSALSSATARAGLTAVTAGAQPMVLAIGGATTAMGGLAAASRVLGATLSAALGPIGLIVSAIGLIGSAVVEVQRKKEEDRAATAAWAREYQERSREVVRARDEVVRAHQTQIEVGEAAAQVETLEHELELLTMLGASTQTLAEKQAEIHEARVAELETSGDILRTDRQLAKLDVERAESALKRLQSERNKAAAIDDSAKRTEQLRAIEEQILEAQEGVTAAISNQNAVRERGIELSQQQLDLDRKREIEKLNAQRGAVQVAKDEAVAAWSGATDSSGAIPMEAIQGARDVVLAAGGTEADADEVTQKIIEGTYSAPPKKSGSKKPKKEEKVEARFADYLDVLKAYADSRAGVDVKALDSLAKGTMPKDHRPETSIQITNHNTYTIENEIVIGTDRPNQRQNAVDLAGFLRAEIDKTMKQTPNGLVR